MEQLELFDFPTYRVNKPIRLIELFAGVGSQAMSLRNIGANFEHYQVCEFDKYAVASYNAIHGTNFEVSDVTKISGNSLGITDTKNYEYILTYSFPCTDLSLAGKGLARADGLKRGGSTRSGLLWEVERLLNECEELPQVLLMENVPQVATTEGFKDWIDFLSSKGYQSFYKILNAKNYGIPQNRERCFMFSFLTNNYLNYEFPEEVKLDKTVIDYLENSVDDKYYINGEKYKNLIIDLNDKNINIKNKEAVILTDNGQKYSHKIDVASTLLARDYKGFNTRGFNAVIENKKCILDVSMLGIEGKPRVYRELAPTLTARDHKDPRLVLEPECINLYDKNGKETSFQNRVYRADKLSPAITTAYRPSYLIKQATKTGYIECNTPAVVDLSYPESSSSRGRVIEKGSISPTLTTGSEALSVIEPPVVFENRTDEPFRLFNDNCIGTLRTREACGDKMLLDTNYRIRKLTPKECWRLMAFTDEDYEKASKVNSNTQLYKQAGNSIVVTVLEALFKSIIA